MPKFRLQGVIAALALASAAVAPAVAQDGASAVAPAADRFQVVQASGGLDRKVRLENPIFTPIGRFTRLQFRAVSKASSPDTYEYKVDWYDRNGVTVSAVTGWQTMFLSPSEQKDLVSVGQSADAYSARVTIREPERVR